MTPRRMASPQPVRMPVGLQRRSQAVRLDQRRSWSWGGAIGGFAFLVAFVVGLLVVAPTLAFALAGGRP